MPLTRKRQVFLHHQKSIDIRINPDKAYGAVVHNEATDDALEGILCTATVVLRESEQIYVLSQRFPGTPVIRSDTTIEDASKGAVNTLALKTTFDVSDPDAPACYIHVDLAHEEGPPMARLEAYLSEATLSVHPDSPYTQEDQDESVYIMRLGAAKEVRCSVTTIQENGDITLETEEPTAFNVGEQILLRRDTDQPFSSYKHQGTLTLLGFTSGVQTTFYKEYGILKSFPLAFYVQGRAPVCLFGCYETEVVVGAPLFMTIDKQGSIDYIIGMDHSFGALFLGTIEAILPSIQYHIALVPCAMVNFQSAHNVIHVNPAFSSVDSNTEHPGE